MLFTFHFNPSAPGTKNGNVPPAGWTDPPDTFRDCVTLTMYFVLS